MGRAEERLRAFPPEALFLVSALVFNPQDSLIGIASTAAGAPVYRVLTRKRPA